MVRARLALTALAMVAATATVTATDWWAATAPPELDLPRDHGAHPEAQSEWWYLTALVDDAEGRRFGLQITFFRFGLEPEARAGRSELRATQVVAAHVAVADLETAAFRHGQRLRRTAGGLAGFAVDDLEVGVEGWRLHRRPDDVLVTRIRDRSSGVDLDLRFEPLKPLVAHGEGGLSRKGPEPGNASIYLTWPRLEVRGSLALDGVEHRVVGTGWFDHEWGTSQLGEDVVGWDWFSLRLDDGRDLMVYRLRRADGSPSPFSSGSLIGADGSAEPLPTAAVELEVTGSWTSPHSDATYPSGWRLAVAEHGIDLAIEPLLPAAEVDGRASTGVIYWEGPVTATGSHRGEGYVELTGYAGSLAGRF